jgi:glycosyltransferase involved in cell wall biosynthesis
MKMPYQKQTEREGTRVLVVAPTPFFSDRGCHVRILEEIRAAEKNGYQCTVCTYHLGKDVEGVSINRSLKVPWYRKLSAGPSIHKFYIDLLLLWTCLVTAWRIRPDIIHGHLHEGIVIGKVVSVLCGSPLIGDLQGSLVGELVQHNFFKSRSLLFRLFAAIERWIIGWPDHLILGSDRATEGICLHEKLPVPATILEDGVDEHVFTPREPGETLREKLAMSPSLPSDHKVVGFLGLLNEYQGVDTMLETARRVVDQFPNVHFLIMGYPNVEKYSAIAAGLGLSKYTSFPGRIPYEQARDYLAACDIAFSAKQNVTEANGKLLNYMAVGLPTVATDTRVNKQLLGHRAALYGRVDDASALAEAVLELLRDEAKAKAMGAAARHRAIEKYSWSVCGRKLEKVYRKLMQTCPVVWLLACGENESWIDVVVFIS